MTDGFPSQEASNAASVGPMLVQRWHTTIGITLCQRWPNVSAPMLAQRWANIGVQPLGQRWANWQIHVGPTLVSRRWPNVRVDVGPTLGQRHNASWGFIPCMGLTLNSNWLTTVKYIHVSHVWRHQREIWWERNTTNDVTMAITTAICFPCRCDGIEQHCVYTMI